LEAFSELVTEISAADSARSDQQHFSDPSWSRYIPSTASTTEEFWHGPIIDLPHLASKSAFSLITRGNNLPEQRHRDDRSRLEFIFPFSHYDGLGDCPDPDVVTSQPPGAHTDLIADQQEQAIDAGEIGQSPVPNSIKEKQNEERTDLSTPVHKPGFDTKTVKPCPRTRVHRLHEIAVVGGTTSKKEQLINLFLQRETDEEYEEGR
jgi:hypothetical protein